MLGIKRMKRRILLAVGVLLVLPVLWFFFGDALKLPTPFDAEIWKSHGSWQSSTYPRLSMADDLIKKDTLKGLTKSQAMEMLGDPGNHGYFRNYYLVYWLGPERSFIGIDSEWLVIAINKTTGLVENYELVRD